MPPLPTPPSNGAPPVLAMGASPAPPAPAAPAPAALPADFDMQAPPSPRSVPVRSGACGEGRGVSD